MCRVLLAFAGAGLLGSLLRGQSVGAQTPDLRTYEHRSDSLLKAWHHLAAVLNAYNDSVAADTRRYDVVALGALRVLAEPALAPMTRDAVRKVDSSLAPVFGRALDVLTTHRFAVSVDANTPRDMVIVAEVTPDRRQEMSSVVVDANAQVVASGLRLLALQAMARDVDPAFTRWLRAGLPQDTATSATWAAARIELLSSPAFVGRRCYAGEVRACLLSLSLLPVGDTLMELFDVADRRRMLENFPSYQQVYSETGALSKCLSGVDSACVSVLRRAGGPGFPDPIATSHRLAVVQLATSLGGPGAYERLLLTKGTPSERIAAAARMPTDSVIRLWLARARDTRMGSDAMSWEMAASSLAWILACGGLAMRGSRWR